MHTIPQPTSPVQTPWEVAVQQVAARAKAALGIESHSRIDRAVEIVLAGGVHLNDDHSGVVESQSAPLKGYAVNGVCPCMDFQRAPAHFCKHRLALCLYRRALELEPPAYPAATVALVAQEALALPEAPASVNVRLLIGGRDVQLTLRDTDEARLLTRLHAVLAQYPGTEPTPRERMQQDTEGWCALHGVQMRQQSNKRGSWWSHRLAEGGYCKGK